MHKATDETSDKVKVRQKIIYWPTYALLFFVIIALASFQTLDNCGQLENGEYKVQLKHFPQSDYILLIKNNEFIKTDRQGQRTEGTIQWNDDYCYFTLSTDTVTRDNPTMKKIVLGMGYPCYEIIRAKGRVTKFRITRSGNLNVTIAEGKFKKIK